jgi:hypothetical protein
MSMNNRQLKAVRRPSDLINTVLETLMCSLFPSLLMDERPARRAKRETERG